MKKISKTVNIIGWTGTIMLITAYTLNSLGIIESTGPIYGGINIIAGTFLGIRVYADRNWANLSLEVFWVGIAIINIIRYFFFS